MSRYFRLPSPALVVASVALFIALTGGAAAGSVLASTNGRSSARLARSEQAQSSLARRVATLESKVKGMQKQQSLERAVIGISMLFTACRVVTTADAFQGTWQTIDQLSAATQAGKTYFGTQTRIDDRVFGQHACTALRLGRSRLVPPNVNWFTALLQMMR